MSSPLSTFLEPSGMTEITVNECAEYADWFVVLKDGTGFLLLESNQITLLGVARESRGKGKVRDLVEAARLLVYGRPLIIHAINEEVAAKVYAPLGFQSYDGLWMEMPTIQYIEPTHQGESPGHCTI